MLGHGAIGEFAIGESSVIETIERMTPIKAQDATPQLEGLQTSAIVRGSVSI